MCCDIYAASSSMRVLAVVTRTVGTIVDPACPGVQSCLNALILSLQSCLRFPHRRIGTSHLSSMRVKCLKPKTDATVLMEIEDKMNLNSVRMPTPLWQSFECVKSSCRSPPNCALMMVMIIPCKILRHGNGSGGKAYNEKDCKYRPFLQALLPVRSSLAQQHQSWNVTAWSINLAFTWHCDCKGSG